MIPGAPHPLLMAGGGDPIDELGSIAHMLRFRRSATAFLSLTWAADDNRKTLTLRVLHKRGSLDALEQICAANYNGGADVFTVAFLADNTLRIIGRNGGVDVLNLTTSRVFRGPAALIDIHVKIDTTQATASSRVILSINGVPETSFVTANYPAQNTDLQWGAAIFPPQIGRENTGNYLDGPIGQFAYVAGQALPPTVFGQFHPLTKQWRPKTKAAIRAAVAAGGGARNGWGVNGCFLPFEPADFAAGIVYDRSQSDTDTTGNNWTLNNINVTTPGPTYDLLTDGTDNFATFNPLDSRSANTYLNANLRVDTGAVSQGPVTATINFPESGKWRVDTTVNAINADPIFCVMNNGVSAFANYVGFGGGQIWVNGSVIQTGLAAPSVNQNVSTLIDKNTNQVRFLIDGVQVGTAVTVSIQNAVFTLSDSTSGGGCSVSVNFGQQPWPYLPGFSDYKGLSAKNLPKPTIPNVASCFAAVTDSGANILATLAAARTGWPAYIDIVKRRDPTAEGWRWSFSDDPGYALDSASGTAGRFAYPALAGTSYVGYSLKVSAANGVATGRLAHVSGTADTVVDGLGNARKVVILVSETSGNWFFYHPDLTAGKLLYLNSTAGETADASISAMLSNSFTAAAALPSGMYRWIALAEGELIKLFKDTGNGSTDGPMDNLSMLPLLYVRKLSIGPTASWHVFDGVRNKGNVCDKVIYFDDSAAEVTETVNLIDLDSTGAKMRGAHTYTNNAGSTFVGLAIGQPFRYANAR
ncbi:hypothetical protein DLREEDagrD3_29100 [Denitratisoma sp. agr-D3]